MKKIIFILVLCIFSSCSSTNTAEDEKVIDSPQDRMFSNDFESESRSCWSNRPNSGGWNFAGCGGFSNIGSGASVDLAENEVSHSGNKSLKVTYNLNEDHGGAEVRFPDTDHIFTRYYDYYASNFDFPSGLKTHRIRSFNETTQINDFDILTLAWGRSLYAEESDMRGTNDMRLISINSNGGEFGWSGDYSDFGFERNRWYCIETEIRLNSAGNEDGLARLWVDGVLQGEKQHLNIRGSKNAGINLILFGGWYSNGAGGKNTQPDPQSPSIRYIDDVALSTSRIGCFP